MLNPADPQFEADLRAQLPGAVFRDLGDSYLEEPRGRLSGTRGLLLAPSTTQEVAGIVTACNRAHVGVIPYGGGTGLVGGQVALEGPAPVILSLERMTRVRDYYPAEAVMTVEAGMVLEDIHTAAAAHNHLFPLTIASKGTARIGGILATNAGGVNVLRYGNARALCLGLEAVMPDGQIWNGLARLRKDNAGYDLRDLLIGAEGTLGVITAANLVLAPAPAGEGTALLSVRDPAAALKVYAMARAQMAEGISAFELIHRQGFDFLAETGIAHRRPLDPLPEWMVLIEVGLPQGLDPTAALETLFASALDAGVCDDGVIASSEQQRADLWYIRETIPEANRRIGSVSSHDISIPMGQIPAFVEQAPKALAQIAPFRINCFGHLGDGNLHFNVFPPRGQSRADQDHNRAAVKRLVHDLTDAFGGSVAAEHGVGRMKVTDLETYGDPVKLAAMRAIKAALDPNGIMNPGAVLRETQ